MVNRRDAEAFDQDAAAIDTELRRNDLAVRSYVQGWLLFLDWWWCLAMSDQEVFCFHVSPLGGQCSVHLAMVPVSPLSRFVFHLLKVSCLWP